MGLDCRLGVPAAGSEKERGGETRRDKTRQKQDKSRRKESLVISTPLITGRASNQESPFPFPRCLAFSLSSIYPIHRQARTVWFPLSTFLSLLFTVLIHTWLLDGGLPPGPRIIRLPPRLLCLHPLLETLCPPDVLLRLLRVM